MTDTRKKEDNEATVGGILMAATVAAAGIWFAAWGASKIFGFAAWGASKIFGSASSEAEEEEDNRKKMKAPGRNGKIIDREDFVDDPSTYFRQLHRDIGGSL